jgi:thiol-disulfide isomerase/thioredoxin
MLELGTKLPEFDLINSINNKEFSSKSLAKNKGKLVMFICNHCPFVKHLHQQIIDISSEYSDKVEFVAISSNDVDKYPQDAPEKMKDLANSLGFKFPYLFDETQEIAKKYKAVCTPEFYLFNENDLLIYRGRMDDSSPLNGKKATGSDLRNAIDQFLKGERIDEKQYPSMGCNIKWK